MEWNEKELLYNHRTIIIISKHGPEMWTLVRMRDVQWECSHSTTSLAPHRTAFPSVINTCRRLHSHHRISDSILCKVSDSEKVFYIHLSALHLHSSDPTGDYGDLTGFTSHLYNWIEYQVTAVALLRTTITSIKEVLNNYPISRFFFSRGKCVWVRMCNFNCWPSSSILLWEWTQSKYNHNTSEFNFHNFNYTSQSSSVHLTS